MGACSFGLQLQCRKDGGRKNYKKNPTFARMEADLHYLVPAVGKANEDRSIYSFAMLEGEQEHMVRAISK